MWWSLPVKGETPDDDRDECGDVKHKSMRVLDRAEMSVGAVII